MILRKYNRAELIVMTAVRDTFKHLIGEKMGEDPDSTPAGFDRVENRLAFWLSRQGGGEWLRNMPDVQKLLTNDND